jgi:O-antigen ligase
MSTLLRRGWFTRAPRGPRYAPVARMVIPMAGGDPGLRFTDWLFVMVLSLAYVVSVSVPLFGTQLHHTVLNHAALVLMLPVLALHFVGAALNQTVIAWRLLLLACAPMLVLALYMLVGSSVAKWTLSVKETYLALGAYLLLLPLSGTMVADAERARRWAPVLLFVWVVFSMASLAGEIARIGSRETLHEIEYIVTAGFFALYYASRGRAVKLLALVLLLAAAVLNAKLTGYIIAALGVLHVVLAEGWRRVKPANRGLYGMAAVLVSAGVALVLTLLYFQFRDLLPSGNVEVRMKQYEHAMRQFFDSPVWGAAYLDGSGEVLIEGARAMNIPTHSDVLDLLKHGGLIAFTLFAWGYLNIFRLIHRAVRATTGEHNLHAYFVSARFFLVTALVTFTFNPLLLKGPFLTVIWVNLGLAAGMAIAVLATPAQRPA